MAPGEESSSLAALRGADVFHLVPVAASSAVADFLATGYPSIVPPDIQIPFVEALGELAPDAAFGHTEHMWRPE